MLNESLVLIRKPGDGDSFVGCGACIEQNLIVTCRHVWRDADEQGEAVLPYLQGATSALELIDPCQGSDGKGPDVVLLRATSPPEGLTELQLARSETFERGKAHARAWLPTCGFDDEIIGEIGEIDREGRRPFRQGQQDATGYWFEEGSSGSPVFLFGAQQLAGVISVAELAKKPHTESLRVARLVPSTVIWPFVRAVKQRESEVRQRAIEQTLRQQSQAPRISGLNLAINIGGENRQQNISGVAPEVLAAIVAQHEKRTQEREKLIARLEAELEANLDLNQRQMRAALDIVGEANVPPERMAPKLIEIAERFKGQIASIQPSDDAQVAGLRAEVQKAVDDGDLSKADALLAQIETQQRQALDRLAVKAAETADKRGDIAVIRLQYGEAAGHFAKAAMIAPSGGAGEKGKAYLEKEADAFYRQGDEFGVNAALTAAIGRYKQLLVMTPRERVPLEWAMTQMNLGRALEKLGERESGTEKLDEAIQAYRAALEERTRERVSLDWAATQNDLGSALFRLGEREAGTARLEEAVEAYYAALEERTRARVPLDWAATQNNLGSALVRLGERESGTDRLQKAVQAYQAALEERTRERVPSEWAATQNRLGNALLALGQRESGTDRLEKAVQAYQAALEERTPERVPLDWAATQNNLGVAFLTLGDRESGTVRLEQAVAAFQAALTEWTRERVPLDWAGTQHNLGDALRTFGQRENGIARLEGAVDAYRSALQEYTRERVPLQWAASFGGQGLATMLIADRTNDGSLAEVAAQQIEAAYETLKTGGHEQWAAFYQAQVPEAQAIRDRLKGE